ncbi:la-related protein 6-like [Lepisosteus oculatus]|uniref:la-related protein 6-like n=1 Tax=Lepisosteus oculatus TaxID=7918 RepID=UPI00371D9B2B
MDRFCCQVSPLDPLSLTQPPLYYDMENLIGKMSKSVPLIINDNVNAKWNRFQETAYSADTDRESSLRNRPTTNFFFDEGFSDNAFENDNEDDAELDEWTPPDSDLIQKMVSQIEYYLSDENLVKDAFLLKHVKRNKMGYVNIKLLTSFKKMKHFTKDWRVTAFALRHSANLEVNEEGNKVRRKVPVPESLLTQVPSRVLLVWNLPDAATVDNPSTLKTNSIESAVVILGAFGTISTLRIIRPGKDLPTEIRKYAYKYPELGSKECVLVEYEDLEAAGRAYHELSGAHSTMKVLLVGKGSRKKASAEASAIEDRAIAKGTTALGRRMEQLQNGGEDSSAYSSSESECTPLSPMPTQQLYQSQVLSPYSNLLLGMSPRSNPRSSPWSSPRSSPRILQPAPAVHRVSPLLASEVWKSPETSPELCRRYLDYSSDSSSNPGSPWVQRRKLAAARASSLEGSPRQSPLVLKRVLNGESLPPGVIRFPHGPDGTKGFHNSIGRGKLIFK